MGLEPILSMGAKGSPKIQLSNCVFNGIWFLFTLDYAAEEVVAKYTAEYKVSLRRGVTVSCFAT